MEDVDVKWIVHLGHIKTRKILYVFKLGEIEQSVTNHGQIKINIMKVSQCCNLLVIF